MQQMLQGIGAGCIKGMRKYKCNSNGRDATVGDGN